MEKQCRPTGRKFNLLRTDDECKEQKPIINSMKCLSQLNKTGDRPPSIKKQVAY